MTARRTRIIGALLAATIARPMAYAQRFRTDGWLDAGYTRVRQDGFASSDVASLAALWTCAADALLVQASGSLLAAPGGGAIGSAALEGWGRAWRRGGLRLDLGASGDGVVSTDLPSAMHGALAGRALFARGAETSWLALSSGMLAHHGASLPSLEATIGTTSVIAAPGELRLGASVSGISVRRDREIFATTTRFTSGDARYADATLFGEWKGERAGLSMSGGARMGDATDGGGRAFAAADVTLRLAPTIALIVSGGHQLSDPTRGLGAADFASVGMRVSAPSLGSARRRAQTDAVVRSNRRPLAIIERDSSAATNVARLAIVSAGSRVEVMGDFSDWAPIALVPRGGRWTLDRALTAGPHRLLVRVDGGEWTVPANLPDVADDLGGKVGLLVIPD